MGEFSIFHWLVVLAIVLILFGGRKIPEVMKGLGEGIRNFKEGMSGASHTPPAPPPPKGWSFYPPMLFVDRPLWTSNLPKVLLLFNGNPVFSAPPAWQVKDALAKIPFIASFGSFVDDTSAFSDLILPDHSPLESWLDDSPEFGSTRTVVSLAPPTMRPLHNTRAMRRAASGVPSATITMPACCEKPMPTPPP